MATAKQLAARKAFAARAKARAGKGGAAKKRVGKKPAFLLKGKKKGKGK